MQLNLTKSFKALAVLAAMATAFGASAHADRGRGGGHHGPGHGGGHHDNDGDTEVVLASAGLIALSLTTSAIDENSKEALLVQVSEDAAIYLDTGKMTGLLPSMVEIAREELVKQIGAEAAAKVGDDRLVDALLKASQELL